MAEQKKKDPRFWSEEEWKQAIDAWKESDTDFDESDTPLRADLTLHGKHKTPEEN